MMRKNLFSLMSAILLPLGMMAQTVTLTFTGKDANYNRVQLDHVAITNLTKGWQETLYWPDTTLTMQNGTGIHDVETGRAPSLQLSQNNPNPFNGTTDVLLTVADAGMVVLEITDANGRIVGTHRVRPQLGAHLFRVTLSAAGTYVMTARQNGKTSSIKMVNNGGGDGDEVEYVGIVETWCTAPLQPKSGTRGNTTNPFNFGDMMEYVGYTTINGGEYESERISQMQGASQTFALVFAVVQHTIPSVTTTAVGNITGNSATVGGNVTSDGGETVFDRGVCYSTTPFPTVSDNCIHIGQGTGSFSDNLNGLQPETTYYIRAFAINSIGVGYGSEVSFTTTTSNTAQDGQPCSGTPTLTDIDGNIYNTVQIGQQCWMKENLRTSKYADNMPILAGNTYSCTEPYRYAPDNNESNVPTHGYLYNWAAVMNGASSSNANPSVVQGICPTGWHVPSDAEWTQLINHVSSQSQYVCGSDNTYIAKALASTTGWSSSANTCAVGNTPSGNNASGFSALPTGNYGGDWIYFGNDATFWSATEHYGYSCEAWYRHLSYDFAYEMRYYDVMSVGMSVRCVRD